MRNNNAKVLEILSVKYSENVIKNFNEKIPMACEYELLDSLTVLENCWIA